MTFILPYASQVTPLFNAMVASWLTAILNPLRRRKAHKLLKDAEFFLSQYNLMLSSMDLFDPAESVVLRQIETHARRIQLLAEYLTEGNKTGTYPKVPC